MGDLSNPKHELFCRNYAMFAAGARAARTAGYSNKTAKWQAVRLLKRPEIQARLVERRLEVAKEYVLDASALLCKFEAVFIGAFENGDLKTAARVLEAQARMAGVLKGRGPSMGPLLAKLPGDEPATNPGAMADQAVESAMARQFTDQNVQKGDKG